MGKGFFISKAVVVVGIVLCVAAVATIIALSVVYDQEKSKNAVNPTEETKPTSSVPTTTPKPSNEPWDRYRLPDTVVPVHYNLTLWPRLQPNTDGLYIFTGNSTVLLKCVKETDLILIHSTKLNFTKTGDHYVTLTGVDGSSPPAIKTTWLKAETQYLVIELNGKLTPGRSYHLGTVFQGELADDLEGFYRSVYEEDGVTKVVATTQMQATYARKAFPCFDEPAMKATFNITLIHDRGTVALSNGKGFDATDITVDGVPSTMTRFEQTKRMSTYLLAFIVSDYVSIDADADNVMIKIWARRKAIDAGQGQYALNITGPILKFFESYYKCPYPLPKSDQIALPDFNAGAMENWGLITYRETALLYDPEMSSNGNKERVATVVAHELAHMWFGNLVTLKWWNDLWLNEGFASYVEYLGADHAQPDWNIKDQIVLSDVHRVFAIDALASSHPLSSKEEEVNTPAQISEVFDAISYNKGASVLRMLSEFLSESVFSQGLSTYLNHFAYNNTVYTDLWDHLQQAVDNSGVVLPNTVHNIMDRWVGQMGFPVVTINTATGIVSQAHFLLDPNSTVDRPSEFNYEWLVPITWMKSGAAQGLVWLLNKHDEKRDMIAAGGEWLLANINISGYYRVNYDSDNWERLLAQLHDNHVAIPIINRAQIVDDAFNLARAKIIPTELALRTTTYLFKEREYIPWRSAINNLHYYRLMFDRSGVYGKIQAYLKKQVEPLFQHFKDITSNWKSVPTGHNDQYNQVNAIWLACSTGVTECQDLTMDWYKQWMHNSSNNPIHPNLRSTVYCSAIAAGGAEEWDFGWMMFKSSTIASEADKIRSALACTTKPWLLNRYLEYSLDADKIRKQDATSTIVYIASNVVGQSLAWDFIRAQWMAIFTQHGGASFSFANLINGVTKRFSTQFELNQLEQFKKDNAEIGFGSGTVALDQSIERTRANMKWVAENKKTVESWFNAEAA